MIHRSRCLLLFLATICALSAPAFGQDEGQADLDKATELRLSAKSPQDLQQVAELCDAAMRKGLSEENTKFAKQLASGALFDLSSRMASLVLDTPRPDPRWQLFRPTALQNLEKTIPYDPNLGEAHLLIGRLQALPGGDEKRAASAASAAVKT